MNDNAFSDNAIDLTIRGIFENFRDTWGTKMENSLEPMWYKLKSSGKEFHVCGETATAVTWRFKYSVVDNIDTPDNLERASNWRRTLKPAVAPNAAEEAVRYWVDYAGC